MAGKVEVHIYGEYHLYPMTFHVEALKNTKDAIHVLEKRHTTQSERDSIEKAKMTISEHRKARGIALRLRKWHAEQIRKLRPTILLVEHISRDESIRSYSKLEQQYLKAGSAFLDYGIREGIPIIGLIKGKEREEARERAERLESGFGGYPLAPEDVESMEVSARMLKTIVGAARSEELPARPDGKRVIAVVVGNQHRADIERLLKKDPSLLEGVRVVFKGVPGPEVLKRYSIPKVRVLRRK